MIANDKGKPASQFQAIEVPGVVTLKADGKIEASGFTINVDKLAPGENAPREILRFAISKLQQILREDLGRELN